MAGQHVFASVRSARRHLARQEMAVEVPRTSGLSSAAGTQVKSFDRKLKREEWQAQAYDHANQIGELGYVLTLMAATLAKGRLVVVERDELGRVIEPELDDDGREVYSDDRAKAERVLHALRGPGGDHKSLLSALAMHDQIAGEAILIGQPVDGGGISWEIVSVLEVIQDQHSGAITRKQSAASTGSLSVAHQVASDQTLDSEAYLARYHRPDLAYSGDATSALRRNSTVCREIVLLNQLKETMIKSRLAAGVLLVPEEVTFPADDDMPDDIEDIDVFLEKLVEHLSAPVEDRRSAAALAPLVVRVPGEQIANWKLLSLSDGLLDLAVVQESRTDALRRLAGGIDLPLERMEGLGSTNHWTAAAIDTDEVRKHIIPLGEREARFFTVSYFRRMLIDYEEMSEDAAERFDLEYDGSEILTRMDVAASADSLHEAGLISGDARVEAHGFDPDQVRPSDEERWRRLIERLSMVPHANNRVLLSALIDFEAAGVPAEVVEEWLTIPPTTELLQPPALPDRSDDDDPEDSIPSGPDTPASGEPDAATLAVLERIRTAGSSALDLALQQAANQVVTQARRLPADVQDRLDQPHYRTGPRKAEVLRFLGDADWKAIQRDPKSLLRNKFAQFEQQTAFWLGDLYRTKGRATADEDARRVAALLSARLDELALSGFTRPIEREPGTGLSVPIALVAEVAAM